MHEYTTSHVQCEIVLAPWHHGGPDSDVAAVRLQVCGFHVYAHDLTRQVGMTTLSSRPFAILQNGPGGMLHIVTAPHQMISSDTLLQTGRGAPLLQPHQRGNAAVHRLW